MFFPYILIFILGTIIGSFLNVCIYRIPQGQSVVFPPSHCTKCGEKLKAHHLIPLISYILLGGRCSFCKTKISVQYPLVELLTSFLFTVLFSKFYFTIYFFKYAFLFSLLIVISFIDLQIQIIPDGLVILGLITGLIFTFIDRYYPFSGYFLGALIGGGILLLIALLSRGGMGGGDVKLMLFLGLFLGWEKTLLTLFLSFVAGGFFGILVLVTGKKGRKDPIPFGPFINIGAIMAVLFEVEILNFYFSFF
jgi:leader peptidase (prepilin peptidase)/N-methyltransferase